jgi:hypothetical protein
MKNLLLFCLFALTCFAWSGCEKPPIYDDTPSISWVGFFQPVSVDVDPIVIDTLQQLTGVVTFKFDFTDGDGDLGKDNDTTSHIIIIDTRRTPNDTLFYQIPTIEPQGVVSGISGQLEVTMSQLCCIHPSNPLILCQPISEYYDPIIFKILIKDNAGRWSNEIETTPLYVQCF